MQGTTGPLWKANVDELLGPPLGGVVGDAGVAVTAEYVCPYHEIPTYSIRSDGEHYLCVRCGICGNMTSLFSHINSVTYEYAELLLSGSEDGTLPRPEEVLPLSPVETRYLRDRGIGEETAETYQLCILPTRNRFKDSIVFPVHSYLGTWVSLTSRYIGKDGNIRRYNSLPNGPYFLKSQNFFGQYVAKDEMARTREVYIVEGQFDVLSFHEAGVTNVLGLMGSSLTDLHARNLRGIGIRRAYLFYDPEELALQKAGKACEVLAQYGISGVVCDIREKTDPNDFLVLHGIENLRYMIRRITDESKYLHSWF